MKAGHMNTPMNPRTLLALLVIAGATVPLAAQNSPFLILLASHALIAGLVALSLDVLTGNVGLLSFGHAAWYGFGAYGTGLAAKHVSAEMLLALPLAAVCTAVVALAIGWVLVHQVGKTFAILTLALSQIVFAAVFVFSDMTGGEDGLQGIPMPTLLGQTIVEPQAWFWLLYAILLLALVLAFAVRRSPMGKTCLAIRDNTERTRFIGVDVARVKLLAYASSAALAAVAGGLFALFTGAASPDLLHWTESGKILMYAVLGGIGTLIGPVIGAVVFTFTEHYVSSWTSAWQIWFGGFFVLAVIAAPGGLFGLGASLWQKLLLRAGGAAT